MSEAAMAPPSLPHPHRGIMGQETPCLPLAQVPELGPPCPLEWDEARLRCLG